MYPYNASALQICRNFSLCQAIVLELRCTKHEINQKTLHFAMGFIVLLVLIHSAPSGLTIKTEESIKEGIGKCFDSANDACKNQTREACRN